MNELARETLSRFQREAGACLDMIADFDLVRELVDAAEMALEAETSPAYEGLLMPSLQVGNVTLFRLSHGAKLFFQREILPVYRNRVGFCNIAYAWCMAHSREPEKLWAVSGDRKMLKKAVRSWEKSVGVPTDLLIASVDRLLATVAELYQAAGDKDSKKGSGLEKWIAELSRQTGRSVEDLMWRCPEEELILLLTRHPNSDSDPDPDSPYIRAVRVFRETSKKVNSVLRERAGHE